MALAYTFTEDKLTLVICVAYGLSQPQGMGFMHYVEGPLPQHEAESYATHANPKGPIVLSLDYVKGRAVKLPIKRSETGELFIDADRWYDHSTEQLAELARIANLGAPVEAPKSAPW